MGRLRSRSQLIIVAACVGLAGCGGHARASRPTAAGSVGGSVTATPAQSQGENNSAGVSTSAGEGASAGVSTSAGVGTSTSTSTGTVTATASGRSTEPAPHRPPDRDPCPPRSAGALAQTDRVPSATTGCFHAVVRALWRGVRGDSTHAAVDAFFPLAAYEQVKAIGDAAGDYRNRLLAEYDLDLQAARGLLGPDPAAARLVGAIVPGAYVHWVAPGACDNRLGYYEVPNARLVYRVGSDVRSFGIASLISWRGIWYVVHLGSVTRSGLGGVVDDPSDGTGTSAPSLTC